MMGSMPAARRARYVMLAVAGLTALVLIYLARGALIPFLLGGAIAYAIAPLVDSIAVAVPLKNRERARGAAILLLYAAFAGVIAILSIIFVPTIADELTQLADDFPDLIEDGRDQFERWEEWYEDNIPEDVRNEIEERSDEIEERASSFAEDFVENLLGFTFATASAALGYLVIPVWLFYVLKDRSRGVENFLQFLPEEIRNDVGNIIAIVNDVIGKYLRAQLMLGVIVGVTSGVALWLMDIRFAAALGVVAGIGELIPILGPIISAIPAIIVALAFDPEKAIWVALLYLAIQQVENNLLVPRVQAWAIDMNPAVIIVLLIIANAVVGFWGMLVVVPLAGVVREVFVYIYKRLEEVEASGSQKAEPIEPERGESVEGPPTAEEPEAHPIAGRSARG